MQVCSARHWVAPQAHAPPLQVDPAGQSPLPLQPQVRVARPWQTFPAAAVEQSVSVRQLRTHAPLVQRSALLPPHSLLATHPQRSAPLHTANAEPLHWVQVDPQWSFWLHSTQRSL